MRYEVTIKLTEMQLSYLRDLLEIDDGYNWEGKPEEYGNLLDQIASAHKAIHGPGDD